MTAAAPSKADVRRLAKEMADRERYYGLNLPTRMGVITMMILTGIYLMFEVAFAARLLDVVGSTTNLDEIEQIENAGRFISGIALTLVIWSAFVLPHLRKVNPMRSFHAVRVFGALGVSAALCCTFSYVTQEKILEVISEKSSAEQRQAASTLTLVSSSVQSSKAELVDIDLDEIGRTSPEVKTFMALLPALALSVDRLEERTNDALDNLLVRQAEAALGSPAMIFTDVYYPSMNALKTAYIEVYKDAAKKHLQVRKAVPYEQQHAYRQYRNGLGRYSPDTLPKRHYRKLRNDLNRKGVPVPSNWDPRDKKGFYDAIENKMMSELDASYEVAMLKAFGRVLPDDLTDATFFASKQVQGVWQQRIGAPVTLRIDPNLSPEAFKSQLYDPWVRALVDARKPLYMADISKFEEGGVYYEDGVEAIRIAYVPLVAFGFSILGALVHSFKTLNFAAQARIGLGSMAQLRRAKRVKILLAAGIIGLGVLMARSDNGVTNSVLFQDLEARTEAVGGPILSTAIRSVIQLQSHVYPVAEAIRSTILLGITYDFDPETEVPAFELISGTPDREIAPDSRGRG